MQRVYESEDPIALQLIAEGSEFELEALASGTGSIFKNHPRTLTALYRSTERNAALPMILDEGKVSTYGEALRDAAAIAWVLRNHFGVAPGDRVAIVAGNRAEWIIGFIAVTSLRAIAVLVNSRGATEELTRAIRLSECKAGIVDADRAALLCGDNPLADRWIHMDGNESSLGGISYQSALSAAPAGVFLPDDAMPDDGAAALLTSGTTGFPKAALLTHGALAHLVSLLRLASATMDKSYQADIGTPPPGEAGQPMVLAAPFFHVSGIGPMLRAMHFGSPLLLVRKWNTEAVFDLIEHKGVDRLGFVATMLWDMLRSPSTNDSNLGLLRFVAIGGMPISPALVREAVRRMPQCLLATGYGSTETSGVTARLCGTPFVENPTSVGWVLPTMQMRIEREDGSDADVGEVGEVCVRGPCLMKEYMHDPEATRDAMRGGWYHMGDLGFVNERHMLHLVDRKKHMVISGGENIYCAEVERVLADHESVLELVAYGMPDDRLGERLVVTIVPKPGSQVTAEELKEHSAKHLAIYKVPREIFLRSPALPRTSSGKISRVNLRKLAVNDQ